MEIISVIIITYKRQVSILKRAVESVCNQTYKNIEIILVNDDPEDQHHSEEIKNMIKEYDKDIYYYSYDKNRGSNYARNFGISKAKGQFLAFLDDDDEWYKNKLEKQMLIMKTDSEIALVSCGFDFVKDEKVIGHKENALYKDCDLKYLLADNYVGGTSFPLLRREAVKDVGGFDINQKSCQEYDLWIRLRMKYKFSMVDESLGKYYLSGDSVYRKSNDRFFQGDYMILKKYNDIFNTHKKAYMFHLNRMSFNFLCNQNWNYFFKYRKMVWKLKGFSLDKSIFVYMLKTKLNMYRGNV